MQIKNMALSCAIRPKIRKSSGELTESRLFGDLEHFGGRALARDVYQRTKTDRFAARMLPQLDLDENGEPTFASLYDGTSLHAMIPENELAKQAAIDAGFSTMAGEVRYTASDAASRDGLEGRAVEFNKGPLGSIITATTQTGKDGKTGVIVGSKTPETTRAASKMRINQELNARLREILADHGVSIGALTDLEARLGVNGVTGFTPAIAAADGIVTLIRLAKGEVGQAALPEEFSHWALAAMGENPLRSRLLTLSSREDVQREVLGAEYDRYVELYGGDTSRIAEETAGKLLARALSGDVMQDKPYRSLLERVVDAIKAFFSHWSEAPIRQAIRDASRYSSSLADELLSDPEQLRLSNTNIGHARRLFQSSIKVLTGGESLLSTIQMVQQQHKELLKSRRRYGTITYISTNGILKACRAALTDGTLHTSQAISRSLWILANEGDQLAQEFNRLQGDPYSTVQEKLALYRDMKQYAESAQSLLSEARAYMHSPEAQGEKRKLNGQLEAIQTAVNTFTKEYDRAVYPLFADFMRPFLGEGFIESVRKKYQKAETKARKAGISTGIFTQPKDMNDAEIIGLMLQRYVKDITIFDRWLDSASDSSDDMLKVLDQITKMARFQQKNDSMRDMERILAIADKYRRAGGSKDFRWMFAKDNNGKLTGNYITRLDAKRFRNEMQAYDAQIRARIDITTQDGMELYNAMMEQWLTEHGHKENGKWLPGESYKTAEYKALNAVQREFFDAIMEVKAAHDRLLPSNYTYLANAVKIHKDFLQRLKTSPGSTGFAESLRDAFLRRSDDTELGTAAMESQLDENAAQTLPIFYTRMRSDESIEDMSTDVVSTMIAYCDMANGFNRMNGIIDAMEVGRDIAHARVSYHNSSPLGPLATKIFRSHYKTGGRNIRNRIDDFYSSQIYGRYMKPGSTFELFGRTFDLGKIGNRLLGLTALNQFALNLNSGISNVSTGATLELIESICKRYFSTWELAKADKSYLAALPDYLAELGNPIKNSKLALFIRTFDTLQDNKSPFQEVKWDRARITRLVNSETLYILNTMGEHFLQNRSAIAMAYHTKMLDSNGKETTLWDALEVVPIDTTHPNRGSRLRIKEGYKKADGTAFNITGLDAFHFRQRISKVNRDMHGTYNREDSNALQRLWYGRAFLMFRKWMRNAYNKRFASQNYSLDLDEATEGHYRSLLNYFYNSVQDIRHGQFKWLSIYNELAPFQQANIRHALVELLVVGILRALSALTSGGGDDDDVWSKRMFRYQVSRLYSEMAAMSPTPLLFNEGLRILKSPMASISTLQGIYNLWMAPNYMTEDDIIHSGRYKGWKRGEKYIIESPLFPFFGTIQRAMHPEDMMQTLLNNKNY